MQNLWGSPALAGRGSGLVTAKGADRVGEHHPGCHQWGGWQATVSFVMQVSGCGSLYPAALSTCLQMRFLNRPGLSFLYLSQCCSHVFAICLPFMSNIECHNFNSSFIALEIKHTPGTWKSISPIGCIHLNETQGWNKNLSLNIPLFQF